MLFRGKSECLPENSVVEIERSVEFGERQAEKSIPSDGGAHDAVERETQVRAQRTGLTESEPHFAAHAAVCGFAADIEHIHQHRRRRRIRRRMGMDRPNQRGIR